MPIIPAIGRRITASPGKKCESVAKRAGDMAQVIEHLPSKCKAPGSSSSTAKTKKMAEI
jgi:hypothetical protein